MSKDNGIRDDFTSECITCGKDFPRLNHTMIEGAVVDACDKCASFGTKVSGSESVYNAVRKAVNINEVIDQDIELIADYGSTIIKVRKDKGLSRIDLADRLNEKESVIKRLEDQEFKPDASLVKKIENFLDIRLREKIDGVLLQRREKKRIDLTLGDVVEVS